jgi:hypothetical protein
MPWAVPKTVTARAVSTGNTDELTAHGLHGPASRTQAVDLRLNGIADRGRTPKLLLPADCRRIKRRFSIESRDSHTPDPPFLRSEAEYPIGKVEGHRNDLP